MADETVTEPDNTNKPNAQAATVAPSPSGDTQEHPAAAGVQPTPAPTPKAMAHPHVPSPAALAGKGVHHDAAKPAVTAGEHAGEDITQAKAFGRIDEQGTVYVKDKDGERKVGEFPGASADEALTLYARRFLDIKDKLDLFAKRLGTATIKPREIEESVRSLGEETSAPEVVGDLSALRSQYEEVKRTAEAKRQELAKARKEAVAKALEERTAIVAKAEGIADSLGDDTNWRQTADKFRSLFDQWQQHQRTSARLDKTDADALWKRFSAARTTFNQARRKWAQNRDTERAATKQAKEAIIAEANALKDSTDWGETSHKFNELMDRWKQAGRAGRNEDDTLWARFREAADTFFNARQADRDQMHTSEEANLAKKEALLTKAEALVPVKDVKAAKQARLALATIQEQWDEIGYVPREDMRRIEGRLDAVDKQIKAVEDAEWTRSDPEADARKSSFEEQLNAQLAELDASIAATSDPKKKRALEAEKATKQQWLNAVK